MLSEMLDAVKEAEGKAEEIIKSAKEEAARIQQEAIRKAAEEKDAAKKCAASYETEQKASLQAEEEKRLSVAQKEAEDAAKGLEDQAMAHQDAIKAMLLDVFLTETDGD